MRFYGLCVAVAAFSLASGSHVAAAIAADPPKATDLIFEHKHLAKLDQGTEVDYKFNRTVSNPQLLGQPFDDKITMKITGVDQSGGKDIDLQIYTGDRARALQKLPGLNINPVFTVYFSQGVS